MIYFTRFTDVIKAKIFKRLTHKIHAELQQNNGYFAVFLNDSVSNSIQTSGLYEKEILIPLFQKIEKLIDCKSLTAIDVGANVGNHTLFFNQYFGNVISFEPNPITFKILEVNTYFHKKKINIYNLGLSDINKDMELSVKEGNVGGSSAVIDFGGRIYEKINVIKLDDFTEIFKHQVGLIKIDVEGMESKVLIGGKHTILNYKPIILFELLKLSFDENGSQTINILKEWGYSIFILKETYDYQNKIFRIIKRIFMIITHRSIKHEFVELFKIKPKNYQMLVAIHNYTIENKKIYGKNLK